MPTATIVEDQHAPKANMDAIYVQPDPRAYFRELGRVDYAIPDLAKPVFQRLAAALCDYREPPLQLLDLGCSYGVNAALLKHDLTMAELREHWADAAIARATPEQVAAADRRYFAAQDCAHDLNVVGLDQSEPAVAFAEEVGLLDAGLVLDLEASALPRAAADIVAPTDLMLSTGCVGYISERTFERLLPAVTQGHAPWIGNFVLRMFPFDAIEATLAEWGYVTEKLDGKTFVQREFVSADEQVRVLEELDAIGVDPAGREVDGHLHAEFFLSRPAHEAGLPLAELLSG